MTDDTSRAALQAVFDSALDAMILVDDTARVVDANPAAAALRGEPRQALIGRWIGDLTPRDALDRGFQRWSDFIRVGTHRDTGRLVRSDGTECEVEYAATANVMPGRHLWVLRDVTDRNRAQRTAQFQANLLDHLEAAVVAVDARFRVTHWNAAAERLYGVPAGEAIGQPVADLVVAEGAEGTAREVAERVSAGAAWEGEFNIRRRDGDPLTAWVLNAPIPDPDGGVAGYVGIAVDMTERREAERELERQRATMQAILDSALDAVVAVDVDGRTVEWNSAAEATFGYSREQAVGSDLLGLIGAPASVPGFRAELDQYRRTGSAWSLGQRVELTARHANGTEIPVEISIRDAQLDDHSTLFTAYIRDISQRKATEELLRRHARQQATVAALGQRALSGAEVGELMSEAVSTVAETLEVQTVAVLELQPGGEELLVRAVAGAPSETVGNARLPAGPDYSAGYTLAAGEPVIVDDWNAETRFQQNDMLRFLRAASIVNVVINGPDGRPWGILGAQSSQPGRFDADDVNFVQSVANVLAGAIERRRVEDAIRHRALHDDLTGLPNRALFIDRLEHALAQVDRRGNTVAVIFLDIDQFKVVNDSLGHQAGDRLLQAIVPRLTEALRPGDTLARFAGDEFVVLCEGLDDDQNAVAVAERLIECFSQPFALGDRAQYVSVSMGIALPGPRSQTAEQVIRDADTAMYRAKERGRARYELFDERMRVRTLVRMRIDHDLRRAVPGEDLHVHYQPIVSLADGDVAGFEALMRWTHPGRGDVSPAEFIPIAEESGLIGAMGRWILEQAAEQAVRWRGLGGAGAESLTVSVNLSARQFAQGQLADEVATVLGTTGLEPERLMLEITESVLMDEADAAIAELNALKDLGVKLVLDDFGTGYSSLSYLERFPIDALKIDRSFIAALDAGGSGAIVDAIVSMAHSLDLRVTAEGVETEDQIEHLRRIGCGYAQGWYFGRPAPPSAHDGLISSRLAG
jgi:diguanylate cyclase (GGDEF)-like protein/PAS domain S-box-containing protein